MASNGSVILATDMTNNRSSSGGGDGGGISCSSSASSTNSSNNVPSYIGKAQYPRALIPGPEEETFSTVSQAPTQRRQWLQRSPVIFNSVPRGGNRGPCLGIRHLQTLLLFLIIVVNYAGRLNVSLSLVAMTNAATTNPDFPEFDWDEKQRSYVISSFYWGYFITQFPGGYMAQRLGVKITLLIASLGSAVLSLAIPFCVPWGEWQVYCGIRVCQGLFQGMVFPCVHEHLAKWCPVEERTRLGGLSHTGIECGTILAMGLTGIVAESSLGWPGVSFVFGGIGITLCVIWLILADNDPNVCRFITDREQKYIRISQAMGRVETGKKIPIPWTAIFTSIPFLSLLVVRICEAWGFTTMQLEIPAYLHGVLKMDIKSNALYSALPYLTMWIMSNVYLITAEILLKNEWMSLNAVRKTINTIALWVPAALLVAIGFLDENQTVMAITFMTLNVGLNGGQIIGSSLNTIDLSPHHAGILMGIVNTMANIIPILTPLVVGIIVYDETQRKQWQIVFLIAAVLFFLGNFQYIFLGSTITQPWDDENFLVRDQSKDNKIDPIIEKMTGNKTRTSQTAN